MSRQSIQSRESSVAPLSVLEIESQFGTETEGKIGVELELFTVDLRTGAPRSVAPKLLKKLPENLSDEHLNCQIEIKSSPQLSLAALRDELSESLDQLGEEARRLGTKLLWSGLHPTLQYSDEYVVQNARTIHNQHRFGPLIHQLSTCGLHVHVGVAHQAAMRVRNAMQPYIPLLVALAANSPIYENRETGRRSQRAVTWNSGFPVCGISEAHTWESYNARNSKLVADGRIEAAKDLYDLVRPTRFGTIEVRCCDMPSNLDQVIALTALIQTLVVTFAENGESAERISVPLERDLLDVEFNEAATKGPEAMLTNHQGELMSPRHWLAVLAMELQPVAERIGTDVALRFAAATLEDNGSTRQLQTWRREQSRDQRISGRVHLNEKPGLLRATLAFATATALLVAATMFAFAAALQLA